MSAAFSGMLTKRTRGVGAIYLTINLSSCRLLSQVEGFDELITYSCGAFSTVNKMRAVHKHVIGAC